MSLQLASIKTYYAPLSSTVTSQVFYAKYFDLSAFQQVDYFVPTGLTVNISISSSDSSYPSSMAWDVVASSVVGPTRDRKGSSKITAIKIDRVSGSGTVEVLFNLGFTRGGLPPTSFSGLAAYYEADQGITLDGSNAVSQWNDLSGNGAHLTQSTAGSRPKYAPAAFGGAPAVSMSGAGNQFMSASPTLPAGAPTHTVITIVKMNGGAVAYYNGIVAVGSGSAGGQTNTIGSDPTGALWFGGAGLGTPTFDVATVGNIYYLAKTTQNVSGVGNDTAFVNGSKKTTYVQPGAYSITPANTLMIGRYFSSSVTGNWDISAVAVFSRILTDGEIQSIISYYNNKFRNAPNESIITSNLTLRAWYKADSIAGVADGGLLDTWNDSSGNGRHLTASGALRPTFYSSTTAQLKNGLPTIAFNGSNALSLASGLSGQPCTIFIVARTTVDLLNQYFVDGILQNTMVVHRFSGTANVYAGSALTGPALANNTYTVICAKINGASSAIRSNGTEVTGAAGALTNTGLTVGNSGGASAGVGLNGNIAEVIVASGTYSGSVVDSVCAVLSSKWNI
jgi:hypothetical protein